MLQKITLIVLLSFLSFGFYCSPKATVPKATEKNQDSSREALKDIKASSPNGQIALSFGLKDNGQPWYKVDFKNQATKQQVIKESILGFEMERLGDLWSGFTIVKEENSSFNETWETVWGEERFVENNYNEYKVFLSQGTGAEDRLMNVVFRVFDDGIGFRYEFPEQANLKRMVVVDERTEFNLAGDHTCWWTPGDYDCYEHLINKSKVSEVDNTGLLENTGLISSTVLNMKAVNTPFTMKTDQGLYLSIHEAALYNYPGMTIGIEPNTLGLYADLVPLSKNNASRKAEINAPFNTPWRTIQIAEKAGGLIDSYLIMNLNEPAKIKETDWIYTTKYLGIWWEMHIDKATWDKASGRHGATTANAKRYIDFASKNGIPALLIEGWNTGWEKWIGFPDREGVFDFVTPYDDYNLEEVVRYAKENGVKIIMHNETSAATATYDKQITPAFQLYQKLKIDAIKSGYVGPILPDGRYHHGQQMVKHYQRVLEKAARFKIMMNVHEPIKATGIRRTWPNMMTREGARGQEFNAWGKPNNGPAHLVTLPFTRGLGGPMDFTPGIFDITIADYPEKGPIPTTLAKQLATYVLVYSPFQMAADLPENYEGNPAFQFIKDVGTDWDETLVIDAEVGEHLTMVRKERGQDRYFLGSATNETARVTKVPLTFLPANKQYVATIYSDGKDAHYENNPTDVDIDRYIVDAKTILALQLAPGGGTAIKFRPASRTADRNIRTY